MSARRDTRRQGALCDAVHSEAVGRVQIRTAERVQDQPAGRVQNQAAEPAHSEVTGQMQHGSGAQVQPQTHGRACGQAFAKNDGVRATAIFPTDIAAESHGDLVRETIDRLKGPQRRRQPYGASLRARDLRGRNLLGFDLEGADLRAADLRDADLRGANLYGAWMDTADLRGARIDMTRIVEISLPETLEVGVVNQIRHFDFQAVMTRFVGPNSDSETLPCPYRDCRVVPLLYRWGSDTWNSGASWSPPNESWTLEEIIGSVLESLGCQHDFARPFSARDRA